MENESRSHREERLYKRIFENSIAGLTGCTEDKMHSVYFMKDFTLPEHFALINKPLRKVHKEGTLAAPELLLICTSGV